MKIGWMFIKLPVLYVLGGIFLFLIVATTVAFVISRLRPGKGIEEVRIRIRTWWIMISVVVVALTTNLVISLAFFSLLCFLALREFLSLIPTRKADRLVLFCAYLVIPLQYYWIYLKWYGMFIVFIPVYVFLFFPLLMVSTGETQGFLRAIGTLHWGLMTAVFSISHAAFLLVLPDERNPGAGNLGNIIFLLILTQANDVAQFLWGKTLGRHKITPRVSPNKTWEGFLGGVVTTVVLSWALAPVLTPLSELESLLFGLIIAIPGFVGDVTLSAVKRDINVKDSGSILPGHGGILDRVDSLTFTAPLFFHVLYWLYY